MTTPPKRGGARKGAGRPKGSTRALPTTTGSIRCTLGGWQWLRAKANATGHGSIGKWADAKGKRTAAQR